MNIEHIPYLLFISLIWIEDKGGNFNSNEGNRKNINLFLEFIDGISTNSKGNGYPVYYLFHYFKFKTPIQIYNDANLIEIELFGSSNSFIFKNSSKIIMYLINYCHKIINNHFNNPLIKSEYNKYHDKWINFYENKNQISIKKNIKFILDKIYNKKEGILA